MDAAIDLLKEPGIGLAVGVVVGVIASFLANLGLDWERRRKECKGVATALYHEVANRAGRCAHDYIEPWRHPFGEATKQGVRSIEGRPVPEVVKFLPQDPVTYPRLAEKLALVDDEAHARLIDFYYHHHAWGRDLKNYIDKGYQREQNVSKALRENEGVGSIAATEIFEWKAKQARFLAEERMRRVLFSGQKSLEPLRKIIGGNKAFKIDKSVADLFLHLQNEQREGNELQDALEKHGKPYQKD